MARINIAPRQRLNSPPVSLLIAPRRALRPWIVISFAIDAVYPALEIIETRGDFTAQIALAMADNAQQKTVVLGEPVALGGLALDQVAATVRINGQTVATGRGDAVLGNPLNSVIWLARKLGEFGRQIGAGDIIMSGSFTRQFPIEPGDQVEADFGAIGKVVTGMLGR